MPLSRVFEPIKIGGVEIPNRIVRTAHDTGFAKPHINDDFIAYHLARRGARVLIVDQHGAGNSRASSGGESRIIRMSYGADEIYTRSSMRSPAGAADASPRSPTRGFS